MTRQLPPSPPSSSLATTKAMKANRGKGTKPEILLRKSLWREGARGYRLNWKGAPGRPDICFPGIKLAIFVHGCFWHRCPSCHLSLPKTNTAFWKRKFELNIARDVQKEALLRAAGWEVVIIWECALNKDVNKITRQLVRKVHRAKLKINNKGS